jgi:hypothetical protein
MTSGTTWYLHSENNALLCEKELKAKGVQERRYCLQAASMTFALVLTRSGSGNSRAASGPTQRPAQVSCFQQEPLEAA